MEHHVVLATPPGEKKPSVFGLYTEIRWQWALKHARYLRDIRCTGVVIEDEEEKGKPDGQPG